MSKILIIVDGGIADYVTGPDIDVAVFDYDNWKQADAEERKWMMEHIKGFEGITPEWIIDLINEESEK